MMQGQDNLRVEYGVSEDSVLCNGNADRYIEDIKTTSESSDRNFFFQKEEYNSEIEGIGINYGYLKFELDLDNPDIINPPKVGIIEKHGWTLNTPHALSFSFDIDSYYHPNPAIVVAAIKTSDLEQLVEIKWLGPDNDTCVLINTSRKDITKAGFYVVKKPKIMHIVWTKQDSILVACNYEDGTTDRREFKINDDWKDQELRFWLGCEACADTGVVGRVSVKCNSIRITHHNPSDSNHTNVVEFDT
jgi:hypothetical protein